MDGSNLIFVILDGKTKISQFSNWEGYPAGVGATILNFLRNTDLEKFKKRLKSVRFATKKDQKEMTEFEEQILNEAKEAYFTIEQSNLFNLKYPLTRDLGGGILQALMDSKEKKPFIIDTSGFEEPGEWKYIINFDTNRFEVYYDTSNLLKSYPIGRLPSEKNFLKEMNKLEENLN